MPRDLGMTRTMNKEELKEKYGKKRVPHQWRGTDFISTMVCTFLGSGMSPKAPGTMGSLAAAIVAYPMARLFVHLGISDLEISHLCSINLGFLSAAIIVFFAAIPFVNKAMKDTQTEDPGWIVIDEVCGVWMALSLIPNTIIVNPLLGSIVLLVAFGVFRFFDILKPLGIHRFEKFPGAWGVMADDLLGGVYAGLLTAVIAYFFC